MTTQAVATRAGVKSHSLVARSGTKTHGGLGHLFAERRILCRVLEKINIYFARLSRYPLLVLLTQALDLGLKDAK
ncbi:unannotated protein [freshwater metagenome]|uniref:Unannotated protein n=1 Tax=freshwater metagenome TaxID=449393 RepID=A0A6J7FEH2_9ZZZZ